MGDFTSRCAISGIPLWNKEVIAVALTVAYNNNLRCGAITTTDMFHIASLPIYGHYNGYGFIEEIHNPHSEKVSCEAWSDEPAATYETVFRECPQINRQDYFGKPVDYKTTFALIDAQVWFWLLENSAAKKAELLEAYKTRFLADLVKIKEDHQNLIAELGDKIKDFKNPPTIENDVRWCYKNIKWDKKDVFRDFMYAMDSVEILSQPFCRRAFKAFIEQDMEVVEGLIELFCVTLALRDIDKFWQPSSTCGDQYGDITKMKVKFAEFHTKNMKAMRKEQKRIENED
jgi:hypothetical protein